MPNMTGNDEGPGADPVKTGCRDTARGHRRATDRVPAPAAEGTGADPDVRSGARCAILGIMPTTEQEP
jgi:hypothetical protein